MIRSYSRVSFSFHSSRNSILKSGQVSSSVLEESFVSLCHVHLEIDKTHLHTLTNNIHSTHRANQLNRSTTLILRLNGAIQEDVGLSSYYFLVKRGLQHSVGETQGTKQTDSELFNNKKVSEESTSDLDSKKASIEFPEISPEKLREEWMKQVPAASESTLEDILPVSLINRNRGSVFKVNDVKFIKESMDILEIILETFKSKEPLDYKNLKSKLLEISKGSKDALRTSVRLMLAYPKGFEKSAHLVALLMYLISKEFGDMDMALLLAQICIRKNFLVKEADEIIETLNKNDFAPSLAFQGGRLLENKYTFQQGLNLLERASNLGHSRTKLQLSMSYGDGILVEKNDEKAFQLANDAVTINPAGFPEAKFLLGKYYWSGQGVKCDKEKAFKLYQEAAVEGLAVAQHNLGVIYFQGGKNQDDPSPIKEDIELAVHYWELAAEQNFPLSIFNLGKHYFDTKQFDLANKHLEKAAVFGGPVAEEAQTLLKCVQEEIESDKMKAGKKSRGMCFIM